MCKEKRFWAGILFNNRSKNSLTSIGDGLAVAIALWPGVAAVLLDELGGHGHAEVIVKLGVRGRILCGVAVKGKEHPLPFY